MHQNTINLFIIFSLLEDNNIFNEPFTISNKMLKIDITISIIKIAFGTCR